MPFQSEKQRRFLHANHPEIAKRWEREYATGGISNHFRKKIKGQPHMLAYITPNEAKKLEAAGGQETMTPEGIPAYPEWDSAYGAESKESFDAGIAPKGTWGGGGGDGGGPPIILNPPPKGPSPAELAAAKAKAEAEKRALEAGAKKKHLIDFKDRQKKKLKFKSKFDTPAWDTDIAEISLYDKNKTIDDYINLLDDEKELNFFEKQHLQELENLERIKFEDQFKEDVEVEDDTPGGYIERENRKFHKLAMVTDKQKKAIKDKMNMLNRGLIDTKTVYDNTKIHDDRGSTGVWGIGAREAEPMSIKEFNKELKDQGYTGTDFIPEVTAVGAKGGVARKNYFHGGILDINESEEIISDDGNDIELTAYNAAFDEPTGVKSLLQAKDGGRIGLYQGGGPHGKEEDSGNKNMQGSDRGPLDDPDRFGPTTTTTISTPKGGGPDMATVPDELGNINEDLKARDDEEQRKAEMLNLIRRNQLENPGREDLLRTYTERMNDIQTEIKEKWRKKISPTLWEQYKSLPTLDFLGILTLIAKDMYDVRQIKKDMAMLEELGLDKGHPSGTDTAYSQLQDYLAKRKLRKDDDTGGPDGPPSILNPVTLEVDEEYAQGYYGYPDSDLDRIRAGQAKYAAYIDKIEREKLMREDPENILVANRGGLANLFRVKNQ